MQVHLVEREALVTTSLRLQKHKRAIWHATMARRQHPRLAWSWTVVESVRTTALAPCRISWSLRGRQRTKTCGGSYKSSHAGFRPPEDAEKLTLTASAMMSVNNEHQAQWPSMSER